MNWYAITANLCGDRFGRLWMIQNLKKHGAGSEDLLDIKQVRCVLELAAPVWNSGIKGAESQQLERVRKTAFSIILGRRYTSYKQALFSLKMDTLEDRRKILCENFAIKSQGNEKFSSWFTSSDQLTPSTFQPVPYRTKRYKTSPLPYLTSLLNGE